MKRTVACTLAIVLAAALAATAATGIQGRYSSDRLTVSGESPSDAWIGVSVYPAKYKDAVTEGSHRVTRVRRGAFREIYPVAAQFKGGAFEVALWSKKVERRDCKVDGCVWCAANGFHMDGQLGYGYGALGGGK